MTQRYLMGKRLMTPGLDFVASVELSYLEKK